MSNEPTECYYEDPEFCNNETWECKTCGTIYCTNHFHETEMGTNVECSTCEKKRIKNTEPKGNTNCLEGWQCPKCKNTETFYVDVVTTQTVLMSDDGHEDESNVEHEWGNDSHAKCGECGFSGYVGLFKAEFEEITPKMKKYYLDHSGARCPFCKADEIEGSGGDFGEGANQKVSCLKCDRDWTDVYTLVDIEI